MNEIVLCEGCVPNKKYKTCIEPGCKTLPIYNIEGEKLGLYCSIHKK